MQIDLILFDLGGVLVEWDGMEPLIRLSGRSLSSEDARRFWLESPWVRRFETGMCGTAEFAQGVCRELDLKISPVEFLDQFLTWDRGPRPGAEELLLELVNTVDLGCLSNNNELHWTRLKERLKFARYFRFVFASHEIGLVKPDPGIFKFVLENVSTPPGQILFFDDNPECISAAREFGIQAHTARSIPEVRSRLLSLKLLPVDSNSDVRPGNDPVTRAG